MASMTLLCVEYVLEYYDCVRIPYLRQHADFIIFFLTLKANGWSLKKDFKHSFQIKHTVQMAQRLNFWLKDS